MQAGQIIHRNGERLICIRTRESGLHTFQVIDLEGNAVIKRFANGMIQDYGTRLINYYKLLF